MQPIIDKPPSPYHQLLFCFYLLCCTSSIFSPSWFSLSFRNFHVSGTVGNNHSHCRNIIIITIIPFVEIWRFLFIDTWEREREREKKKKMPIFFVDLSLLCGTTSFFPHRSLFIYFNIWVIRNLVLVGLVEWQNLLLEP